MFVVRQFRSSDLIGSAEGGKSERDIGAVCRWSKRTPVPVDKHK